MRVNAKLFKQAKQLLELGLTQAQVTKIVKMSNSTVSRIAAANSLKEYREEAARRNQYYLAKAEEAEAPKETPISSEIPEPEDSMEKMRREIEETHKNVKLIGQVVTYIYEEIQKLNK